MQKVGKAIRTLKRKRSVLFNMLHIRLNMLNLFMVKYLFQITVQVLYRPIISIVTLYYTDERVMQFQNLDN